MLKNYQHWDWVCDIGLHYLLACASKYVCRWRQKDGLLDLEKAIHYLDKFMERNDIDRLPRHARAVQLVTAHTEAFVAQFAPIEGQAITSMVGGSLSRAKALIRELAEAERENQRRLCKD